jgi:uncharacterized membrane protein
METMELVNLVSRWLHILAAVTAVGGTVFIRLVLWPTLQQLPEDARRELHANLRRRWAPLVHGSIGLLLVTGLFNIVVIEKNFHPPTHYHAWFGVKFLLALAVMGIGSILVGRSPAAEKMRANAPFWITLNLLLAIGVILISGYLRSFHTQGLPPKVMAVTAPSEP